jgi:uncharacterized protein (DUF2235 family)
MATPIFPDERLPRNRTRTTEAPQRGRNQFRPRGHRTVGTGHDAAAVPAQLLEVFSDGGVTRGTAIQLGGDEGRARASNV